MSILEKLKNKPIPKKEEPIYIKINVDERSDLSNQKSIEERIDISEEGSEEKIDINDKEKQEKQE